MTSETNAAIRYHRDADGVVTLTMDMPGQSANVMNAEYHAAMGAVLARLEAERDTVRGVILTSAKKTFFAGGDLNLLVAVDPGGAAEFAAFIDDIKAQLRRLETLGRPVVAALGGSALGGGWEIALACHRRVCLDDEAIRLGLPEVTLGLLPGAGGVVRTVRLLGLEQALPLLMEGKRLRPRQALAAGLVHELAATPEELLARARDWVLANPEARQPWDTPGYRIPGPKPTDPAAYPMLAAAPAVLYQKTHGTLPAPEKILAAAVESALVDFDTAQRIETRYLTELATGQVAKNMIGTFWFQMNEIKAGASRPAGFAPYRTRRVGVLGAGMMGAGIAQVSAAAGLEVVLKDVSAEAAAAGKQRIAALLGEQVAAGRMTPQQRDQVLDRITPTASDADLAGCDLVIEAVFEDRALKEKVLAAAEAAAPPDAVISSNTSTLPITGLAGAVPEPARFIGLHFFSPVHKMPLVEIIRGARTGDATLARAFDYVRQIGKTPIVVNDGRGFFTSRVFGAYATEGIAMLAEGVHPALIENEARKAGMPVGPLAVSDEVTLSLMWKIGQQTVADLAAEGRSVPDHPAYAVIDLMVNELGRTGRAGGAGFYEYPEHGRKYLWPELLTWFGADADVPPADVRDRLLFVQALETVRCVAEGVLTATRDANVGSVLGLGFAPWTGGVLQFVNQYGLAEFVARAEYLAKRYGDRFTPPALLREKAARGERF
ncbi:3-hydroxyacyl-CoA dehydrogenase [Carbonactinospora thermoautotrophica]|uniref:3-hydroxyacyl-CoA dehydrogenase n=2 Tax=Carbonactinospora thermoautotrophica TaxID=1469144 RepID=A0A132MQS5_9ACTN|nr:3-hydroxyacyl-CoA dehydrogenase NAD-binding domain-containing protein [Carbonactinospora thermoautotrophica]KWX00189.1 3-hydroxyacyl-CoA dehydrogenase [Carbonactinospora thermoautotrophica]